MKKRILAMVMAACLVMSLAACSSSDSEDEAEETEVAAEVDEETEAEAEDEADGETEAAAEADVVVTDHVFKIGMVTDTGGINDQSFNQSSWEGLQMLADDLGPDVVEVKYLESSQDSDYATNIETLMDDDCDLIICVGYMLADATRAAAESYPDQLFAIIDDDTNSDLDNVACLMFEQAQASYLVGLVAGMMTETDTVGFVIGMSTGPMNEFGYGYCAGVLAANPDATILQYNANSFGDTGVGKTAAKNMITNGADVIFHAAGGTGGGVIEACAEEGIWAIGVDTDQNHLAPDTVVTSAMKRVDNASYDIAMSVIEGSFVSGVHLYGLDNGGVDIAPTTTLLPDDVLAAVEDAKTSIISGDIEVPKDQESFEAMYGSDVYELD